MVAPKILRNSDKENRPPSCPRRDTFQTLEERKQELFKWRKEQQEFRLELVQQELLNNKNQNNTRRPRYKMIGWFIVGFLAMIPLMSTYQDARSEGYLSAGSSEVHKSSSSGRNQSRQSDTTGMETLMVSVSHVDYSILPTPKSFALSLQQSASHGSSKLADPPQEYRVTKSHPLWTLKQPEATNSHQQQGAEATAMQSFQVVTVVQVADGQQNQSNQTERVVAVALLSDHKNADGKTRVSHPLDFVEASWHERADVGRQSQQTYLHEMHLHSFAWSTEASNYSLPETYDVTKYTATLDSVPTFRDLSIPQFQIPISSGPKRPHVLFFGWDETFTEMERFYQSFSQSDEEEELQATRKRGPFLQSINSLLQRKHNSNAREFVNKNVLNLQQVPRFLEQLEEKHGTALRLSEPPTNESTTLVVGSSVYDVLAYHLGQLKRSMQRENETYVDGGSTRWFRRVLDNQKLRGYNKEPARSEQHQLVKKGEKGNEHWYSDSLEENYLLACQTVIRKLQDMFPYVNLIWRLPLFLPGVSDQLGKAERTMMESSWKIGTWDLYSASYVAWVSQQLQQRNASKSFSGFGSTFYQQAASAALRSVDVAMEP